MPEIGADVSSTAALLAACAAAWPCRAARDDRRERDHLTPDSINIVHLAVAEGAVPAG